MPTFELLSTPALQACSLALDAAQLRQTIIAANIANASNSNYMPLRVDFEKSLQAALAENERGAAPTRTAQALVVADDTQPTLDQQLVAQSTNVVQYQAVLRSINAQLDLLNLASNDGRK